MGYTGDMETEMYDGFAALLINDDIEPFEDDIQASAAEYCAALAAAGGGEVDPTVFHDRFLAYLAGT